MPSRQRGIEILCIGNFNGEDLRVYGKVQTEILMIQPGNFSNIHEID